MKTPADCRRCGVCGFSQLTAYVRVTGADWARLGDAAEGLAHFLGHCAFMRMVDGHCAELAVTPGPEGRREFSCGVYERRPQICRDLARGSPQCHGEIAAKRARTTVLVAGCRSGSLAPR